MPEGTPPPTANRKWDGLDRHAWRAVMVDIIAESPKYAFLRFRDDLPHHALIRAYRQCQSERSRQEFGAALAEIFAATHATPGRAPVVYSLLQTISFCTPLQAEQPVWERVCSRALTGFEVNGFNLHLLALSVCAWYGVTPALEDHIFAYCGTSTDQRALILGLGLLARIKDSDAWLRFLEGNVLPSMNEQWQEHLGVQLRDIVAGLGYADLFRWYRKAEIGLKKQSGQKAELFENVLRSRVLPWEEARVSSGSAYALVSAFFWAGHRDFRMEEIVSVARGWLYAGQKNAAEVIERIWKLTEKRIRTQPWKCRHTPDNMRQALMLTSIDGREFVYIYRDEEETVAEIVDEATPKRGPVFVRPAAATLADFVMIQ